MSKTVLQVNFEFTSSVADLMNLMTPLAEPIAAVPGLFWKIWLLNEAGREAGGIYLFESREAAQAFITSEAIKGFASHPTIANLNAKMFAPDEVLSKITRAPLDENSGLIPSSQANMQRVAQRESPCLVGD
jgi:hypothetical protein